MDVWRELEAGTNLHIQNGGEIRGAGFDGVEEEL